MGEVRAYTSSSLPSSFYVCITEYLFYISLKSKHEFMQLDYNRSGVTVPATGQPLCLKCDYESMKIHSETS
jgi:hypothetical protein